MLDNSFYHDHEICSVLFFFNSFSCWMLWMKQHITLKHYCYYWKSVKLRLFISFFIFKGQKKKIIRAEACLRKDSLATVVWAMVLVLAICSIGGFICEEGQSFISTPFSQTQGEELHLCEPGLPVNPLSSFIKSVCLPVTVWSRHTEAQWMSPLCSPL